MFSLAGINRTSVLGAKNLETVKNGDIDGISTAVTQETTETAPIFNWTSTRAAVRLRQQWKHCFRA